MTEEFDRNGTPRREREVEDLSLFGRRRVEEDTADFDLTGLTLGSTFEKGKRLIDAALPLVQLELLPASGMHSDFLPSAYDVNNRFEFLQANLESFDELLYLHFRAGMALAIQGRDLEASFHFDQVIRDRRGAGELPAIYIAQSMYQSAKLRMGFGEPDAATTLLEQAEDYLDRRSESKSERQLLADVLITRGLITASFGSDGRAAVPLLREGLGIGALFDRGFSPMYSHAHFTLGSLEAAMGDLPAAANAFGQGMQYSLNWRQVDDAHRFLPFALQMCLYSGSFDQFDSLLSIFQDRVIDDSYCRSRISQASHPYISEKEAYAQATTCWRGLREWVRGETEPALSLLRDSSLPVEHQREAVKSIARRLEGMDREREAVRIRSLLEHLDDGGWYPWRS